MASAPYGLIYLIRNDLNGKVYVGQTTGSIYDRWKEHVHCSKTRSPYRFLAAIRHYGEAAFSISELGKAADQNELDQLEMKFIAEYCSTDRSRGYNIRSGGSGGGRLAAETRDKLRRLNLGRPAHNKGKKMPDRQHSQLIERLRSGWHPCLGRKCSDAVKVKIAEANRIHRTGSSASAETRLKMSVAHKARYSLTTKEQRCAEKAVLRGVSRPDVSDRLRVRWASKEWQEKRSAVVRLRERGMGWTEIGRELGMAKGSALSLYRTAVK